MNILTSSGFSTLATPYVRSSPRSSTCNSPRLSSLPYKKCSERVQINVSGERYETLATTLDKYPETILGTKEKRKRLINGPNNEIFLNRHRAAFEAILFYFQSSGNLSKPQGITMELFENECMFYQLSKRSIKRMKEKENFLYKDKKPIPPRFNRMKLKIFQFLDFPLDFQNKSALLFFIISYAFIIISILLYCAESVLMLWYQYDQDLAKEIIDIGYTIEFSLNTFFALEYLVRLCVFPWKKSFFKETMNFIEIAFIFLYFPIYVIPSQISVKYTLLDMVRLFRALRLTRVSKISKPIQIALAVFQKSLDDVFAVCFCIILICIFFASIMFYIESLEPETSFTSIPQSLWWSMQSVICLGYGDIVPKSTIGKAFGCPVVFLGVVIVTVLILSLGGRFFEIYAKEIYEKEFLPEKKKGN